MFWWTYTFRNQFRTPRFWPLVKPSVAFVNLVGSLQWPVKLIRQLLFVLWVVVSSSVRNTLTAWAAFQLPQPPVTVDCTMPQKKSPHQIFSSWLTHHNGEKIRPLGSSHRYSNYQRGRQECYHRWLFIFRWNLHQFPSTQFAVRGEQRVTRKTGGKKIYFCFLNKKLSN